MCQFHSGIVTYKNRKVVTDLDEDSHEFLLEKANLADTTKHPKFVRVELLPKDEDIWNHDLSNWWLKIDQDIIPDWFDVDVAEEKMKESLLSVFEERFYRLKGGKVINNQRVFLKDSYEFDITKESTAYLYGSSGVNINILDRSIVILEDKSKAILWGQSQGEFFSQSTGIAHDSSHVVLRDISEAILWDRSKAYLEDNSKAGFHDDSFCVATGYSTATLHDNSRVEIHGNSRAELYGRSIAKKYSKDSEIINMHGNSMVIDCSQKKPIIVYANPESEIMCYDKYDHDYQKYRKQFQQ